MWLPPFHPHLHPVPMYQSGVTGAPWPAALPAFTHVQRGPSLERPLVPSAAGASVSLPITFFPHSALCLVTRLSPLSSLKEDRAVGLLVSQYLSRSSDLAKGSIFSDLTFQLCQAQIQGTEVPASAVQWGQQNQANELTVRNFNLL